MYEEVDKINLARHCFQIGVMFCPKKNNHITVKESPCYCGRDHSSAFVYWISVGTRPYIHGYRRDKRAHDCCCCCCCCSHINSHNQVRGHRTGSSHSGAEEYPREKHKQPKVVHAYITADVIHASTRNIKKGNRESVYDVPGLYWCIRLITRAWKNRLHRLPPKKDYHVYITRNIYHYAYARQTQVNWKKKQKTNKKRKERKGKRRKREKKTKKERKEKKRQEKQKKGETRRESKERKREKQMSY